MYCYYCAIFLGVNMSSKYKYNYIVNFNKSIIRIEDAIRDLKQYNKDLEEKGINKSEVIEEFIRKFKFQFDLYLKSDRTLEDYKYFRKVVLDIKNDRISLLETHRGAKQIIGNLVLAVLGMGVIYGLAVSINYLCNKKAFFFQTESAKKVNSIMSDVEELMNNPLAVK